MYTHQQIIKLLAELRIASDRREYAEAENLAKELDMAAEDDPEGYRKAAIEFFSRRAA